MQYKKITLTELLATAPDIELMRIRSCDAEIYIVEMEFNSCVHLVTDDSGSTLQFRGQIAASKPFVELSISKAVLAHQSAYDKMVGQPPSMNAMEIPVSLPKNLQA